MGKTKTMKQQLIPKRVQVILMSRTWICLHRPNMIDLNNKTNLIYK